MNSRESILKIIEDSGVFAVIRLADVDKLEQIITALMDGGVNLLEITYTTPNATDIIRTLSKQVSGDFLIGAGTVLDEQTAIAAIDAGARFIVSPVLNTALIDIAHEREAVCVCGGFSPTEIFQAWTQGADLVKIFPATSLGPQFIKDIHGPLPDIKLVPTGGVDLHNVGEFIRQGACAVGVGTALLDKKMIAASDWTGLQKRADNFSQAVKSARTNGS